MILLEGEQAYNFLAQLKTEQYQKNQEPPEDEINTLKKDILDKYNEESSHYIIQPGFGMTALLITLIPESCWEDAWK